MKIGVISLGCSKNLVDSEILLGKLKSAGVELTSDINSADYVVINTCGFIEDAKSESIDTILEVVDSGKRVLVMGCLVERYKKELEREIPEVEAYFGTQSWDEILAHLKLKPKYSRSHRVLTTPGAYAYLKIAEGCNRLCSFCAIPRIRGRHVSRPIEDVISEVKDLAERGVKEINVVSQDTTYYGKDLYRDFKLIDLLREIEKVEGIEWVRLLYLYPTEVSDDLLSHIKDSEKVVPYFDMPIQHISDSVLRSMRRGYGERFVRELIEKIRKSIPDAVLRTTLIVGYPEEREEDFNRLRNFMEEGHFHWLGVFTYSPEEDTHAFHLGDPVPRELKEERKTALMEVQRNVTYQKNKGFVGKRLKVLVDGFSEEFSFVPRGRVYFQAPEVDGVIYIETEKPVKVGDLVEVEVTQAADYDLGGTVIRNSEYIDIT
ncbi:SSU ribosomal protein S12P methylthiotransferase [Hydrogenivirga caldilitoris]|uniref:Ribosomal protein uS12 methylthiotransferase RimO n=1 Tax=Hydrogenivirga caldilitoris TaxID=246264 RepID=A0A497XN46_9AQUI|nr:30S ribosomal protein S12 methylthiotransferase RimO [Hydrogenivirga caldilitoris]RLJ70376.1 SSU ribosomal protein S12P methylthiotransferase [Hydrogenivirga caldilitoris]